MFNPFTQSSLHSGVYGFGHPFLLVRPKLFALRPFVEPRNGWGLPPLMPAG